MSNPPNMIVPMRQWVDLSRIEGLALGLAHIRNMEDINKEGVADALEDIARLARGINDSAEMEKNDE